MMVSVQILDETNNQLNIAQTSGKQDEINNNIKGCDILPHPEFKKKLYYNT